MNIHPLFVHFPIGLLVVYSVLEIGAYCLPALRRQAWAFPVKAFLLFVGVLAAIAALITGGMAGKNIAETDPFFAVVKVHATFALATTALYLALSSAYLVRVFDVNGWGDRIAGINRFFMWSWDLKKRFWYFVLDTPLLPLIALLALVGISITGGLGASMVYGPDTDPFVSFIYSLFWAQ